MSQHRTAPRSRLTHRLQATLPGLIPATLIAVATLGPAGSLSAQTPDQAHSQAPDQTLIDKGHYLATAADCVACHTAPGGKEYTGGYAIQSPLGTIWSTNITPSKVAGIGNYTLDEFARAVRDGVARDGSHLYPAMPYTSYAQITDEDIAALYAYFMHGVEADDTPSPQTLLPFPFSIRSSMAGWNLMFLDKTRFADDAAKSAEINRGAYLSEALAHCSTCHTPRNAFMAEDASKALAGGSLGTWYAPNITADKTAGIGSWTDDEILTYLKTGHVAGKAQAAGPMAEAIEHSLQHLSDEDLQAIVAYLREVKPVGSAESVSRFDHVPVSATEATLRGLPGQAPDQNGFHVFSGTCAACHQPVGQGTRAYPALFGNSVTGADRPDNLISTILYGVDREAGGVHAYMPGFGPDAYPTERLSDKDIADVATYVLANFGNGAVTVAPADVALVRAGGPEPAIARLGRMAPALIAAGLAGIFVLGLALVLWRRARRPS